MRVSHHPSYFMHQNKQKTRQKGAITKQNIHRVKKKNIPPRQIQRSEHNRRQQIPPHNRSDEERPSRALQQCSTHNHAQRRSPERGRSEHETEGGAGEDEYEDEVCAQGANEVDEGEETHEESIESEGGGKFGRFCLWRGEASLGVFW